MHLTRKRISKIAITSCMVKNCRFQPGIHIPWNRKMENGPETLALASIEECSVLFWYPFSIYEPLIVVLQRYVWRIKWKEINLGHSTKGKMLLQVLLLIRTRGKIDFAKTKDEIVSLLHSAKSGCFYGCQSIFSHMACVRPVIVSLWIELVQLLHPPPHTQSHTRYIFFNWLQLLLPQQQSISSAKQ